MSTVDRYEKAIKAALEVQQLKSDLSDQYKVIAENLTVSEAMERDFDREASTKAIKILKEELGLEEETYVKGSINYKDVRIFLHLPIDAEEWKFMKPIFADISTKDITR